MPIKADERACAVPKRIAAIVAQPALQQIETIRKGIPARAFEEIAKSLGVGKESLARILNINAQTLRKRKSRVLSPEEAEKSLRAARVFLMAGEILGGATEARSWMAEGIMALGGRRPLDLLDTDVGTYEVTNLLNCIKWGVYA